MKTDTPVLAHRDNARHDGAYRGRRITWAEFYKLRPDLKADNDNNMPEAV